MDRSRLVVELPNYIKKEFKIYSAKKGITMSEIIELYILELLTKYDGEKEK